MAAPIEPGARDDDALMAAWQGGDEAAFGVLVERYGAQLQGFLLHLLGDRSAAEDAWGDTFMRVVRSRDRYQLDGRFRAWLYTVARRCALDQRRSQRRWTRLMTRLTDWGGPANRPPDAVAQLADV